jgi:hypothetical protein
MGFTWGVCSSRLTLKRHKARREEGRPYVPNLGQLIREIQRDAAALSTDALRDELETCLDVQDAALCRFRSIRPGVGNINDQIIATGDVMVATVMTALYYRELSTRPVAMTVTNCLN